MSLSSALGIAMTGLRANQAQMSIVSSNVANAQTPGYVAQTAIQTSIATTGVGTGVRVEGVDRQLDRFIQSQLRTEMSGGGYANQTANVLGQLQSVYGPPGNEGSLETTYGRFTQSLQTLSASPGSASAQVSVLSTAQSFAQSLNATSASIQTLRSNAEQSISDSVSAANVALGQIATINARLQSMKPIDPAAASLMDQRDVAINKLAELMDVRVVTDPNSNQTSVFTNSGVTLVSGSIASQLNFTAKGSLDANAKWNADPTKSGTGTLTVSMPNGPGIDLIASNSLSSGKIAADIKLRDQTLVQAQEQVDQLAANLASSLSDTTTAGAAATAGAQTGFDLNTAGLLDGNSINLSYTDTATNTQKQVRIVRVDDTSALPLSNAGAAPNTQTLGVSFAGGMASVVAQLNTALGGAGLTFSNPAGATLRVLNTNASATVNAASTTTTATALAGGGLALPVFTDGGALYTGRITAAGSQTTGLAGRIGVNAALLADPSKLSAYTATTPAGDNKRSDFLFTQMTSGTYSFTPATGLGSAASPYKSTMTGYMQQFLSLQSNAASVATQLKEGQDVVVSTLQSKMQATSGVSIDSEMSSLIALQNTYAANAHVMSVVQQMMNSLLQAVN
ncbi:MAG: Flagellar hook-associated protein [Tardiphaga sp.]|nr:Flagellar hook-associated protein [Tardiphaga sp.]